METIRCWSCAGTKALSTPLRWTPWDARSPQGVWTKPRDFGMHRLETLCAQISWGSGWGDES